jgi:D-xylose transport system permease protein
MNLRLPRTLPRIQITSLANMTIAVLGAILVFNADRGLPLAAINFVGLVILFDLITKRTVYGRHIFAAAVNTEAARRASINVDRLRISVFVLAGGLAAAGGIRSVAPFCRVSIFGRQSFVAQARLVDATVFGRQLGALVIGSISNGMDLIARQCREAHGR